MIRERYESPKMTFEEVRVNEAVANKCWGYHGTGTILYTDIPGDGYMSFQISDGSCAMNLTQVKYYKSNVEGEIGIDPTPEQTSSLNSVLVAAGGNGGTPFKGADNVVFEKPQPGFS